MNPALVVWAGMPAPELTEVATLRLDSLSFFAFVFVASAGLICLAWNALRRDFPALPRLSFWRGLGLTFLWGLLFVLVLTMISGARELLTPGAWKKQGWTYALDQGPAAPAAAVTEAERRQKMEDLRFALWDFARKNGGRFPASPGEPAVPTERWQLPGPSGMRYLYTANPVADPAAPLAWEPEVFGAQRLVLFSDGAIGVMDSVTLERVLYGGKR
jgi:hypothetical protein